MGSALPAALRGDGERHLISTADGRPLEVFDWFSIPATLCGIEHQEDIAGKVPLVLVWSLVSLVGLHARAARKHKFFDHDRTLKHICVSNHSGETG
jgi:cytochrome b561